MRTNTRADAPLHLNPTSNGPTVRLTSPGAVSGTRPETLAGQIREFQASVPHFARG